MDIDRQVTELGQRSFSDPDAREPLVGPVQPQVLWGAVLGGATPPTVTVNAED
ncbi:hypothetical protein [Nocardia cyriacigeorgica]|uniref:hypothetical protein n=1 Tax=Nocardia cyriacigeorgica TaxID=135487 RepID=UPI00189588C6|nr:hypothetical protein [Nocardia cyriacigeorgica]MBF6416993.1 hypothetical protein [Nocardia cyriacigeorgica]